MNTRLLATAIINYGRLVDYSIRLHKQPWSPAKATLMLRSLEPCARRYSIKTVVLSIPHEYHQTKALTYLHKRLIRHLQERGIATTTKKVTALYSLCGSEEKKTKKALMHRIAMLFPEMNFYLYKEERNKNKYYGKLFEAVGVAALHEATK